MAQDIKPSLLEEVQSFIAEAANATRVMEADAPSPQLTSLAAQRNNGEVVLS